MGLLDSLLQETAMLLWILLTALISCLWPVGVSGMVGGDKNYGVDDANLVYVQKEVDPGEDNENNDFFIHKREPYGFGIGKREPYGFGIGKRGDIGDFVYVKREPYGFGIGKRSREDVGSFVRYWGKRQPYNFGVGK